MFTFDLVTIGYSRRATNVNVMSRGPGEPGTLAGVQDLVTCQNNKLVQGGSKMRDDKGVKGN